LLKENLKGMDKQEKKWIEHTRSIQVKDVVENYHNPKAHQKEFSSIINETCANNNFKTVIEIGCETGINCMILDDTLEKTFLDLNPEAIQLASDTCSQLNIKGEFVVGDMFNMNIKNNEFDLIFNSGVVEHFVFEERLAFLNEYSRILKKEGKMILAYPNHYSFLYRSAYVIFKKLLFGFKWPWPKEYKFYNMEKEINQAGLILESRKVIARNTFFDGLKNHGFLKSLLSFFDKIFKFQGYLVVLVIKKK
jgi:ubiquinone/menaquinone biosynthesis C-methylase UbiE